MVNAWSLLYDVMNGTMDENFPIKKNKDTDEIKLESADKGVVNVPNDIEHSDAWYDYKRNDPDAKNPFTDPADRARADFVVGLSTASAGDFVNFDLTDSINNVSIDTSNLDFTIDTSQGTVFPAPGDEYVYAGDTIGDSVYADTWPHAETLKINIPDVDLHASMDGVELPTPGIKNPCNRKYKEDESIKALQDYISTTYGGHYTSDNNDVQTLDLIESVGDAESFCRSNAIKYLSRYDKKGQAKRDILKALHYTLLLYHFSGQLNETPTRGYETF